MRQRFTASQPRCFRSGLSELRVSGKSNFRQRSSFGPAYSILRIVFLSKVHVFTVLSALPTITLNMDPRPCPLDRSRGIEKNRT